MISPELLKSKLLIRLIVAVVLIAAAVSILSLVGNFGKSVSTVEVPVQKTVQPPVPKPVPPPVSPSPKPASMPEAAAPTPAAAVSAPSAVPEKVETPPPPPPVSNAVPHVNTAPVQESKPPQHARRRVRGKTARKVMVGKAGNFALQFGVFSSVPNSERMIARLGKMGVKPAINTRVLAGPYADRRVAENEKKKLGMDAILIDLPGKGYALQVGDFESLEHARALAEKLKRQGIAVMTQTRIRGGAYKSRKSAQAAAARYGKSGLPAFVVRP